MAINYQQVAKELYDSIYLDRSNVIKNYPKDFVEKAINTIRLINDLPEHATHFEDVEIGLYQVHDVFFPFVEPALITLGPDSFYTNLKEKMSDSEKEAAFANYLPWKDFQQLMGQLQRIYRNSNVHTFVRDEVTLADMYDRVVFSSNGVDLVHSDGHKNYRIPIFLNQAISGVSTFALSLDPQALAEESAVQNLVNVQMNTSGKSAPESDLN